MKPTSPAAATQPTCSIGDGVDEAADRFDAGDDGGQGDHRDHEQSGEVFGAAESVGVAAGGGLGAQRERDPQRDRGQRVGEVVDGVGQQRDGPGDHHDRRTGRSTVAPSASRLIFTARMPAALDSSAPSMLSEASWLCGANTSRDRRADRAAARDDGRDAVVVTVPWSCRGPWRWLGFVGHARRPLRSGRRRVGGVGVQGGEFGGVAVMAGHAGSRVFGVEHRVGDQLPDVVVVQAVEDRGALAAGADQPRHPQLRQVLRHRRGGFADVVGQIVDRHLPAHQCPQHLDAGGVGEHPEHLDDQVRPGRRASRRPQARISAFIRR